MMIIGVDYHPSFQQIAFFIEETGECGERRLNHEDGDAKRFYRELKQKGISMRVGMEATGYSRWFERLLAELDVELWIGDPAEIRTRRPKKQKTDSKDAQLLLQLIHDPRAHLHQPMPVPQQLSQIAILRIRHPDSRKVIFPHQSQQESGVLTIGLLLLDSLRLDLRGVADPYLEPQLCQQSLEPT